MTVGASISSTLRKLTYKEIELLPLRLSQKDDDVRHRKESSDRRRDRQTDAVVARLSSQIDLLPLHPPLHPSLHSSLTRPFEYFEFARLG